MFDVLTIGTITRDVFLKSDFLRAVKDPTHLKKVGFSSGEAQCFALGAKVEVEAPVLTIGGGAANAAVTFARQGFRTGAFVKIGKDKNGEDAVQDLKKEKVIPLVSVDPKLMTAYSTLLLSSSGERTILVYRGASSHIVRSQVPFGKFAARWAYIVPGAIPISLMEEIIMYLKRKGTRVAMNPSKDYVQAGARRMKKILNALDVVTMNREEASLLTSQRLEDDRKILRAFDELVPGLAVMTDGPRGVAVSDGVHIWRAGTYKEKAMADRTGAGDAFGSGFVAGLLLGKGTKEEFSASDIERAIRLGSANATSVVEHIGAQEGILKKSQFLKGGRWKRFPVKREAV